MDDCRVGRYRRSIVVVDLRKAINAVQGISGIVSSGLKLPICNPKWYFVLKNNRSRETVENNMLIAFQDRISCAVVVAKLPKDAFAYIMDGQTALQEMRVKLFSPP